MSVWHDGRLVAFDVETTGVDYDADRIVTAAMVTVGGGEKIATVSWLINPGVEIAEEATAVHGITNERASEGQPAAAAVPVIVRMLSENVAAGRPIVAFNARFDLTMLDREARRYGVEPLDVERLRVVDPLVIDKWLHRFRKGSRKLDAMCEHYGASLDGAHEAGADALAAARLAWVLGKRGVVVARPLEASLKEPEWDAVRNDLDRLHAAQVGWADEQAVSLAEYFASQGKPQQVERAWPVVPS